MVIRECGGVIVSYNQLKAFRQCCEYLEIKTLEDLRIVKEFSGCETNKEFLNWLYSQTLIRV